MCLNPWNAALERYDVGFSPSTAGLIRGSSLADGRLPSQLRPAESAVSDLHFGSVGPITPISQKDLDEWYVGQGGFPIPWIDAPVVDPLTPANFLAHWPEIADMAAATAFMPNFPELSDLTLIATAPQAAMLPNGTTENARGLFTRNGSVGEGMFRHRRPSSALHRNTRWRNGYGTSCAGCRGTKAEFPALAARLIASLESFTITQSYIDGCLAEQAKIWGAVAAAGRTLSEASDIIWEGWEARTHSEDISAEKWTDAYRGVERVYDPDTGEVYEVPSGWYDTYDLHRGEYDMGNPEPLPPGGSLDGGGAGRPEPDPLGLASRNQVPRPSGSRPASTSPAPIRAC
jgi:hypothetical protein